MPPEKARQQQPGTRSTGKTRNALDKSGAVDREKLEDNQRQLDVGKDHKTPDMKKRHRGTFP